MNARFFLPLLLLLIAQPDPRYFRYERHLQLPSQQSVQQTCAVLDPTIYAHAAPQLADLRLYRNARETSYVIANSLTATSAYPKNEPLNLGVRDGKVTFDVNMPGGPYTDVWLNIDPTVQDFVLTVDVSGKETLDGPEATHLGSYTIFDLTRQNLGRSTFLHLPPSTFAYLHFSVGGPLQPEAVKSLTYATTTDASPQNIVLAETSDVKQTGRTSVFSFDIPTNVPVDAIRFVPSASAGNFHRQVEVKEALPGKHPDSTQPFISNIDILRYHGVQNGKRIDEEQLQMGIFSRTGATHWIVTVQNGDDPPLALDSVKLEMFEHRLCFDAAPHASYTLYYGDAALITPQYDYASFFHPDKDATQATLGPEQTNPQFVPRPDERPFTEKHPALLWVGLVLVVLVLGGVALRSAGQVTPSQ